MHKALKVLGIVFGLCILLLGGAAGYLYTQQDTIIAGGIDKINEQLKAPVSVEQIFRSFKRIPKSAHCA